MMILADTLFKGIAIYSDWMPRQADNAIFHAELVTVLSTGNLSIDVYHKDEDETGDGTSAGSFATMYAAGDASKAINGLKQLVRYKVSVDAEVPVGAPLQGVLYRIKEPTWSDTAA